MSYFTALRSKELETELEVSQKENSLLRQQLAEVRCQYDKNVMHPAASSTTLTTYLPSGLVYHFLFLI